MLARDLYRVRQRARIVAERRTITDVDRFTESAVGEVVRGCRVDDGFAVVVKSNVAVQIA